MTTKQRFGEQRSRQWSGAHYVGLTQGLTGEPNNLNNWGRWLYCSPPPEGQAVIHQFKLFNQYFCPFFTFSELIAAFVKTSKDINSMQIKSIFCVHVRVEIKQSSQYSIHINNPPPSISSSPNCHQQKGVLPPP